MHRSNNSNASNGNNNNIPDFINDINNTVNINRLRVTGLPFNPSVTMPGALNVEDEVKLHMFKTEVDEVARTMEKDGVEWSNLNVE